MSRNHFLFVLVCFVTNVFASGVKVQNLTCDYQHNPLAVENQSPRLSWEILSNKKMTNQVAYRILVSENKRDLINNLGTTWDTGVRNSNQSTINVYAGKTLEAGKTYYWKVQVWDNFNRKSAWSDIAFWRQADSAQPFSWISYTVGTDSPNSVSSVYYRTTFKLLEKTSSPVYADIATPGFYELFINGKKVGNDKISPAIVDRQSRVFYVSYNITNLLQKGKNVIAVGIGRGWYKAGNIPFSFRAVIKQKDKSILISTNSSWRASKSNYTTTGTWKWANFGGEILDNTKLQGNWTAIDFDDSQWGFANEVQMPTKKIQAQNCELNRITETRFSKVTKLAPKLYELDFGVNLTGFARIRLKGNRGDTIKLYYADRKWNSVFKDK